MVSIPATTCATPATGKPIRLVWEQMFKEIVGGRNRPVRQI
jgi:hypothetical protein